MRPIYNKDTKRYEFYKDKSNYIADIIILISFTGLLSLTICVATLGYINSLLAIVIGIFLINRICVQSLFIIKHKRVDFKVLSIGDDSIEFYVREAFGVKFDYNDILSCDIENEIENFLTEPYIKNIMVIKTAKKTPNKKYEIRISESDLDISFFNEINKMINEKIRNDK